MVHIDLHARSCLRLGQVGQVDRMAPLNGSRESQIRQGHKGRADELVGTDLQRDILGVLERSPKDAGTESRTRHNGSSLEVVATP